MREFVFTELGIDFLNLVADLLVLLELLVGTTHLLGYLDEIGSGLVACRVGSRVLG